MCRSRPQKARAHLGVRLRPSSPIGAFGDGETQQRESSAERAHHLSWCGGRPEVGLGSKERVKSSFFEPHGGRRDDAPIAAEPGAARMLESKTRTLTHPAVPLRNYSTRASVASKASRPWRTWSSACSYVVYRLPRARPQRAFEPERRSGLPLGGLRL